MGTRRGQNIIMVLTVVLTAVTAGTAAFTANAAVITTCVVFLNRLHCWSFCMRRLIRNELLLLLLYLLPLLLPTGTALRWYRESLVALPALLLLLLLQVMRAVRPEQLQMARNNPWSGLQF